MRKTISRKVLNSIIQELINERDTEENKYLNDEEYDIERFEFETGSYSSGFSSAIKYLVYKINKS